MLAVIVTYERNITEVSLQQKQQRDNSSKFKRKGI